MPQEVAYLNQVLSLNDDNNMITNHVNNIMTIDAIPNCIQVYLGFLVHSTLDPYASKGNFYFDESFHNPSV